MRLPPGKASAWMYPISFNFNAASLAMGSQMFLPRIKQLFFVDKNSAIGFNCSIFPRVVSKVPDINLSSESRYLE